MWLLSRLEVWGLVEGFPPAFHVTLTCAYRLVGHLVYPPWEHPGVNLFVCHRDTCRLAVSRGLCTRGPCNDSCPYRRHNGNFGVLAGPSHRIAASGCCASSATGTLESDMMVLPVYLACLAMLTYPFVPFRVDCQVQRSSAVMTLLHDHYLRLLGLEASECVTSLAPASRRLQSDS